MPKVFISYRREDSAYPAHQLYVELSNHFGSESVVFDVDSIPLGSDFRSYLNEQVSQCDVLLAVIGDKWLRLLDERRDDPRDFVRIEIEAALKRKIPVVPVLVHSASMPREDDLPETLTPLAYRNAAEVRAGADLQTHLERVVRKLARLLQEAEAKHKADKAPLSEVTDAGRHTASLPKKSIVLGGSFVIAVLAAGIIVSIGHGPFRLAEESPILDELPLESIPTTPLIPDMVEVPAGKFSMGSDRSQDKDATDDELPHHKVVFRRPFAVGKHEVTFDEYDRFASATGRKLPSDEGWGRNSRPAINVSWDDAVAYAEWLSEQTDEHYRLLTEAEWEYAARAGATTRYWWGDELGQNHGNCKGCGSQGDNKQTAPVGSFAANPFGLHDTAGNVWEWVQDCWHDNYEGAPDDGSAWLEANGGNCDRRVMRGGAWFSIPANARSSDRNRYDPKFRGFGVGFRLAKDL